MKKGFTLIELLAVIVILAIIALIATPMILGVVENAKKGSKESSAYGYIDAVEKTVATNMLDTNKTNIEDGVYDVSTLTSVKVKGETPTEGWVKIEKGQVTACSLKIGEYVVNCNGETIKNGETEEKPDFKYGATMEAASETDTHKGIVYLDPTDLSNVCNKELAESNLNENGTPTGIKTGCMKWYIYSEDDSSYTMILDHNTTPLIKWYDEKKNVAYEDSNLYAVVEDLKITSGWVVNPRIISVEEVNTIIGKTGWTNTSSYYYLDSKTTTTTATSKGASKYAWLFDYTYGCTSYGCNVRDNNYYTLYGTTTKRNIWAYWTSTTRGTAGSGTSIWRLAAYGGLNTYPATNDEYGIRPVITISKSVIN